MTLLKLDTVMKTYNIVQFSDQLILPVTKFIIFVHKCYWFYFSRPTAAAKVPEGENVTGKSVKFVKNAFNSLEKHNNKFKISLFAAAM